MFWVLDVVGQAWGCLMGQAWGTFSMGPGWTCVTGTLHAGLRLSHGTAPKQLGWQH